VKRRVELPGDQTWDEAAERCTHLVRPGWEPLAHQRDDPHRNAGQLGWKLDVVHVAESAAVRGWLVLPRNPEQVERMKVPQADPRQFLDDVSGDSSRIPHLGECRDDDPTFAGALYSSLQSFFVQC